MTTNKGSEGMGLPELTQVEADRYGGNDYSIMHLVHNIWDS